MVSVLAGEDNDVLAADLRDYRGRVGCLHYHNADELANVVILLELVLRTEAEFTNLLFGFLKLFLGST